jgi:hypothetical protein
MRACAVGRWLGWWLRVDADLVLDYLEDPESFHDSVVDTEDVMP